RRRARRGIHPWARHAVGADTLEQRVGGARHVAVVTVAPRGGGGVVRVLLDALRQRRVALGAGARAVHALRQLILRVAGVHRVTRHAADPSLVVGRREAGALHEPVVLTPAHADGPVRPAHAVEVAANQPGDVAVELVVEDQARAVELVTRAK